MQEKSYLLEEVLNDNNLTLNLRLDTIFKKVFLNSNSKSYLCSLISYACNISYEDLMEEDILINGLVKKKKELNKQEKELNRNQEELNNKRFELAKKLIKIGISKNEITKITNLSLEQLYTM